MPKGKKYGGRKAGTPNRTTMALREILNQVMDGYFNSEQFLTDVQALSPRDRLIIMEKLAAYVVPKLQATTIDLNTDKQVTIEDRLIALSGTEVIDKEV